METTTPADNATLDEFESWILKNLLKLIVKAQDEPCGAICNYNNFLSAVSMRQGIVTRREEFEAFKKSNQIGKLTTKPS